jgi:hypothetical protein
VKHNELSTGSVSTVVNTITCYGGNVGGLVGYAEGDGTKQFTILDAYNTSLINVVDGSAGQYGGIVGSSQTGLIKNTYNTGSFSNVTYGSLIGYSNGTQLVYNYYLEGNKAIVSATNGIVNDVVGEFEAKASYQLKDPDTYIYNERTDTEEELAILATYGPGWDFGQIWAIIRGNWGENPIAAQDREMYNDGYPVIIQMYDYNVIDIIITYLEQNHIVEEKHGRVETEHGFILGEEFFVIDDEYTKVIVIPNDDAYIQEIEAPGATDMYYDRAGGWVEYNPLTEDTELRIVFSQYLFDIHITGFITEATGLVPDPSQRIVVFVQNLDSKKSYMLRIDDEEEKVIYAVELGRYQIRVVNPMFYDSTINYKNGGGVAIIPIDLDKDAHLDYDGEIHLTVTMHKYADQWFHDSSTTW